MEAQEQLFPRDLGGKAAHRRIGHLVFGVEPGALRRLVREPRLQIGDAVSRHLVDLRDRVSHVVGRRWPLLTTETMGELADLGEYRSQFLRLFGFGIDGVDYAQDVDPRVVTP